MSVEDPTYANANWFYLLQAFDRAEAEAVFKLVLIEPRKADLIVTWDVSDNVASPTRPRGVRLS